MTIDPDKMRKGYMEQVRNTLDHKPFHGMICPSYNDEKNKQLGMQTWGLKPIDAKFLLG